MVLTLAGLGLKEVILCPGSRDAPLVISFSRHPAFHCTSIRDERSAAFFALGKAIELKQPIALVCTSGSATLNFAPALSEAFYQRIPLIVLTADRPKEWTDQGDGQTINQTAIYRNFVRKSYELNGEASDTTALWFNTRCLCEGYSIAAISDKGPVHFNIPLSEPLYGLGVPGEQEVRIFREEETEKRLSGQTLSALLTEYLACEKVMILAGQHPADQALQQALSGMAPFENVIVLTESTSNIHDPAFIENIDRCITHMDDNEASACTPDLLITVGGAVVSKRMKALLRKHRPKYHWNVHPYDASMDTYQSLTRAIFMQPAPFFRQLRSEITAVSSDYRQKWMQLKEKLNRLHEVFCRDCDYSDFKIYSKIYSHIPEDTYLHLSNSSPIRYAQLFDNQKIAGTWSNRGTSGIDGCTSTAMGAAAASPGKKFLLITGDVAFQYDINGLWNDQAVNNLNILVINNGGGGIFRIIPGPDKVEELEPFFETSMHSDVKKIAAHFKWNYLSVRDEESLEPLLKRFFRETAGRTILEIFTDAAKNPLVLKQYWKYLEENLKHEQ